MARLPGGKAIEAALAENGTMLAEVITDIATAVSPWEFISPGRG